MNMKATALTATTVANCFFYFLLWEKTKCTKQPNAEQII